MKKTFIVLLSLFTFNTAFAAGDPTNVEVTKPIGPQYSYACSVNGQVVDNCTNKESEISGRAIDNYTNYNTYDGSEYSITYYLGSVGSKNSCTIDAKMWCTGFFCQNWHNSVSITNAPQSKLTCATASTDNPFKVTVSVAPTGNK